MRDIKRYDGAVYLGEMVNKLEGKMAPSNGLETVVGIASAMIELAGRARPRTPVNTDDSGSESTSVAAAADQTSKKLGQR